MFNRLASFLLCFVVLFLISSCSIWPFRRPPSELPITYKILVEKPIGQKLSEEFILVADNQVSNLYTKPLPIVRSVIMDRMVNVAIRPIQLDYFSKHVLTDIVFEIGKDMPLINLGYACNFGCTGEFEKFLKIMNDYKGEWFMIPGNHDISFLGNLLLKALDKGEWKDACYMAGEPMSKDEFIAIYLAELSRRNIIYRDKLSGQSIVLPSYHSKDTDVFFREVRTKYPEGDYEFSAKPDSRLHSIAWRIDHKEPWRSYLIQKINMGCNTDNICVQAILFDTTEYEHSFVTTALMAGIEKAQFNVVKRWLDKPGASKDIFILMGHHPFYKLNKDARKYLNEIRKQTKALIYVSADLHKGQYLINEAEKGDIWLELNMGPLTDWPGEIRRFQVSEVDGKLAVYSPRVTVGEWLTNRGIISAAEKEKSWEADPNNDDGYLVHRHIKSIWSQKELDEWYVDRKIKKAFLRIHKTLISKFKTKTFTNCPIAGLSAPNECDDAVIKEIDEMVANYSYSQKEKRMEQFKTVVDFLRKLEIFDEERKVDDPEKLSKFRLSQVYWASKAEYFNTRIPTVEADSIITPYSRP